MQVTHLICCETMTQCITTCIVSFRNKMKMGYKAGKQGMVWDQRVHRNALVGPWITNSWILGCNVWWFLSWWDMLYMLFFRKLPCLGPREWKSYKLLGFSISCVLWFCPPRYICSHYLAIQTSKYGNSPLLPKIVHHLQLWQLFCDASLKWISCQPTSSGYRNCHILYILQIPIHYSPPTMLTYLFLFFYISFELSYTCCICFWNNELSFHHVQSSVLIFNWLH